VPLALLLLLYLQILASIADFTDALLLEEVEANKAKMYYVRARSMLALQESTSVGRYYSGSYPYLFSFYHQPVCQLLAAKS